MLDSVQSTQDAPRAKVFISYSRKDVEFLDRLDAALTAAGFKVFVDRSDIQPTEDWRNRLRAMIAEADAFVFVISPHSVASKHCSEEVDFAVAQNKRLAPVKYLAVDDQHIPAALAARQFVHFDKEENFAEAVAQLGAALEVDIEWVRDPTRLGELARNWHLAGRPHGNLLRNPSLESAERWIASRPRAAPLPTELTQQFIQESRADDRRRRNYLIGALSAGLVVAVSLALFAAWQYTVAVAQTERANRHFIAAKSATDDVIGNIVRALRTRRGMTEDTLLEVLKPAENVIARLSESDDPIAELADSKMKIYEEFSKTFWAAGVIEKAADYVQRALDVNTRLLELHKGESSEVGLYQHRYEELMQKADIVHVQGKLQAFDEAVREAESSASRVLEFTKNRDPSDVEKFALAIGRAGDALRKRGEFAQAEQEYRRGEAIQLNFLREHPGDLHWRSDLSWTDNRLGDNLLHIANHEAVVTVAADLTPLGRGEAAPKQAFQRYMESVEIRRAVVDDLPADAERHANLAWSLALAGMAALAADPAKALPLLDEGLGHIHGVLVANEQQTEWQRYEALLRTFRGDALVLSGEKAAALQEYELALGLRRGLTRKDPRNARWNMDLFYTLVRMRDLYGKIGEADLASRCRDEALALRERVERDFPHDENVAAAANSLN